MQHSVSWLGEGYIHIYLRCPLLCGTLPVVVQFISPTSHRSSSRSFPFTGFPGSDSNVRQLSHILLMCPAQVHFHLLTCSVTSVSFVFSLTQMFVFLFQHNIMMFVCAAASLFFAWLISAHVSVPLLEVRMNCKLISSCMFQCYPWRCANAVHPAVILLWIYLSWFLSLVLYRRRSFQRSRSECCSHILVCHFPPSLLSPTLIFTSLFSLSPSNSCSVCCSSCGVLVHMSRSRAKNTWLRYSPSIFKPLGYQVSHRNMLLSTAVNSLGDMVFHCRTPLLMLSVLLSLCRWTVIELLV